MPRVAPAEFLSLPLEAFQFVRGFDLHDVWQVELRGNTTSNLESLRALLTSERRKSLPSAVRALFTIRSVAGRLLKLESVADDRPARTVLETIPQRLASASQVPPGSPSGPFFTLYQLPSEAAYQALNATVHAILVVALVPGESGQRLFWATYLRPVGRITSIYMNLIDPFRRTIVYPGLERWLQRTLAKHGTSIEVDDIQAGWTRINGRKQEVSEHRARIDWSRGESEFDYESYPRQHRWSFEGGIVVQASAAPDFRGSADLVDPEEAFVASVSSCHMLTFLALASKKRFVVDTYEDHAVGTLEKNADGKLAVTRIVLDPKVAFGGSKLPTAEELDRLHHQAHEHCFIANSVRTEITLAHD